MWRRSVRPTYGNCDKHMPRRSKKRSRRVRNKRRARIRTKRPFVLACDAFESNRILTPVTTASTASQ